MLLKIGLKKLKTAVILQARLDSSRLPGKTLLPLGSRPVLQWAMDQLRAVSSDFRILACPRKQAGIDCALAFAPFAAASGFEVFEGEKEDVLSRFCDAVRFFGLDSNGENRVIRATGDNPFVFAKAARCINEEAASLGADYAAYAGLPYGAGVESVSVRALLKAEKEASSPAEREHVCPYFYGHPELFTLHRPLAPRKWRSQNLRVTIDTRTDYERALLAARALETAEKGKPRPHPHPSFCAESIILYAQNCSAESYAARVPGSSSFTQDKPAGSAASPQASARRSKQDLLLRV